MRDTRYSFSCAKICRSYRAEIPTDDSEAESSTGAAELWTLTITLKDLPSGLKYGPNARHARLDAPPAKQMLETLRTSPETFVLNNNGMMVVAKSLKATGNTVELVCDEPEDDEDQAGHGVLNGGHTYLALTEAKQHPDKYPDAAERATVIMTVALNVADETIWKISKARNTSQKVPMFALRNLAGDWSNLREHLPEATRRLVAFKPNDPNLDAAEFDVTEVVRRLVMFNNDLFPAEKNTHPSAAYTSIGSLVKKYEKPAFDPLVPLLPDIIRLEELVVRKYEEMNGKPSKGKLGILTRASGCSKEPSKLLSGYEASLTLAAPFVLPVMAAFRVFIKDGQWCQPLDELWAEYGVKTIENLWEAYQDTGKSSAAVFGRSKSSWASACDHTKMVALSKGIISIS
jgi:hypothetical protein